MGKFVDLTGKRFNSWTVLSISEFRPNKKYVYWNVKCDCGNLDKKPSNPLTSGSSTMCLKCVWMRDRENHLNRKFNDIAGKQFGKLVAIHPIENEKPRQKLKWLFWCECGGEKEIIYEQVITNRVQSCGCLRLPDLAGKKFTRLLVIKKSDKTDSFGRAYWDCVCDCGTRLTVSNRSLIRTDTPSTKSCGCIMLKNGYDSNTSRLFNYYSYDERDVGFFLTFEEFSSIIKLPCGYCGEVDKRAFKGVEFFANGIDRIDNKKGYTVDNSAPCCKTCNFMKRHLRLDVFKSKVKQIYNHLGLK